MAVFYELFFCGDLNGKLRIATRTITEVEQRNYFRHNKVKGKKKPKAFAANCLSVSKELL
jgi:hypothetical protein